VTTLTPIDIDQKHQALEELDDEQLAVANLLVSSTQKPVVCLGIWALIDSLAEWVKHDYKLNDSEIALFFGDVLKYDITELVDPHFDVVAKVPKSALATLNK